ncbi:GIY-YIG nuclease family protein [Neisseria sp.]|uniref:GIY-YIG nuclease family protein n=1 Tax=Neisseria sp. TaxID=192066 RepID=UPI0028988F7D|nr:GIY-YIG nuclease family protein [Neisseria sp.]
MYHCADTVPADTDESGSWSVYLILCEGGSLYCGISNRPAERFAAHRSGKGAKYTRIRKPLEMRLLHQHLNRSDASKQEAAVKKLKTADKQSLWQQALRLAAE